MVMQKDEGYAWIVAAASALLMFVGPSSYSSSGLFFANVNLSHNQRIWICQTMYIFWCLVAPLAGPLCAMYTHRRVVMISCFISACGLSVTAITLANPGISFFTFSALVGIGLGLATHSTFLLVSQHFRKHRGFAIGIGIFSAGIGQAVVPVICSPLMEAKNIFFVRALMTAIAFMGASLYISPGTGVRDQTTLANLSQPLAQSGMTGNGVNITEISDGVNKDAKQFMRKPTKSNQEQKGGNGVANNVPDTKTTSIQKERKKSQSQLLAGVSANLLPNISEEFESSPLIHRKEIKGAPLQLSAARKISPINMELAKKFNIKPIDDDLEEKIAKVVEKAIPPEILEIDVPIPPPNSRGTRRKDSGIAPASIRMMQEKRLKASKPPQLTNPHPVVKHVGIEIAPLPPDLIAKISAQAQGQNTPTPRSAPSIQNNNEKNVNGNGNGISGRTTVEETIDQTENTKEISLWHELWDRIDFEFLINFRFLNISLPGGLSILLIQNFPIVFTSYITSVQVKGFSDSNANGNLDLDSFSEFHRSTEVGLATMFTVDTITRLAMSYASDFNFFSRRWAFFAGSIGTAIICLGTSWVKDVLVLQLLCAGFGFCFGTMMVTQSLMLVDGFGIKKLTSTYGLINLLQIILIIILTPIQSPITAFMYNFHPLKSMHALNGTTTEIGDFDPLDLFEDMEDTDDGLANSRYWLRILSIPGFILLILWTFELFRERSCRFKIYSRRDKPNGGNRFDLPRRTNSNPLV